MTDSPAETRLIDILTAGYEHARDSTFLRPSEGHSLTYAQMEVRSKELAGALVATGVQAGDRVVVSITKSVEAVACYLSCLRLGAIYVPINESLTQTERDFFIEDTDPAALITDPDACPARSVMTLTLGRDGTGTLSEVASGVEPLTSLPPRQSDDIAVMLYTSGTTGKPKGAMLTNASLIANATALHQAWGFSPNDVLLHPLPIFHTHGLFVALHCAMLSGCEVRFLQRFSVNAVLRELPDCTVMMAVPTMYSRMMGDDRFNRSLCENMRLFISGSAPMTAANHTEIHERTGHSILERYGMTETGIITTNPLDGARVSGTVGFALPNYEIRVVSDSQICERGDVGVIEVRGPHLFAGYWGQPRKASSGFRDDGFFVTGDIGTLDTEDRLTLQGRSSDVIISGGENIYPKEIELCLDTCPGVTESAVIGRPDKDLGESVAAYITVNNNFQLTVLKKWAATHLASFKRPVSYTVIDEFPRNALGKVQKNMLGT